MSQIRQQHPSGICFITPGWHVTHSLNLLSLTMGKNSKISSNKYVRKTIMALKPNQLQVTTISAQANAIIEQVHKVVNDMLRSFDLENKYENLEEQKYLHLITSFNQLHGHHAIRSTYLKHCRKQKVPTNLCLAEI
jgi:hypothetical protein